MCTCTDIDLDKMTHHRHGSRTQEKVAPHCHYLTIIRQNRRRSSSCETNSVGAFCQMCVWKRVLSSTTPCIRNTGKVLMPPWKSSGEIARLRQLGHAECAMESYRFDRFALSMLVCHQGCPQTSSIFTEFVIAGVCAAQDVHNACCWSLFFLACSAMHMSQSTNT